MRVLGLGRRGGGGTGKGCRTLSWESNGPDSVGGRISKSAPRYPGQTSLGEWLRGLFRIYKNKEVRKLFGRDLGIKHVSGYESRLPFLDGHG